MADRTIDIDLILNTTGNAAQGAKKLENSLKAVEAQANRTREKMEKLANVGAKMTMIGGAILAPFALSLKKFVDANKETSPIAKRIVEAQERMGKAMERVGAVTAEIVLPALEKAADVFDRFATFAEQNPGLIKAALGIGGSLVILGGIVTTTAQVVSTMATVQGLLAGAGIGGGAAGAAGVSALGATLTTVLTSPVVVGAFALAIGAEIGRNVGNWLAGTNQTWGDIAETARMLAIITREGWKGIIKALWESNMRTLTGIISAVKAMGDWIAKLFGGGRASGGYVGNGIYRMGERGAEFVLSAQTTKAAENAIGGRLTQGNLLGAMSVTNNLQIGNGITIAQHRRSLAQNRAALVDLMASI